MSYSAGWNTETLTLSAYAGRTIAAINLRFAAPAPTMYNVNIGELAYLEGQPVIPPAPKAFAIDAAYVYNSIAEVLLSWTLDPGIWYYDISRVRPDGSVEALGRTLDEVFYVKEVARIGSGTSTRIQLTPVTLTGGEGPPATATLTWPRTGTGPADA